LFFNIILLIIGFLLLSKGSALLVDGASAMARKLHVPEIIIGLTIVACGTSAPEAAVSISSVFQGAAGVGVGNILGSNITNILLILGISALITNLYVQKNTALYEIPFVAFISVLLMFIGWQYGMVYRGSALILCVLFLLFLLYLFFVAKNHKDDTPEPKNISSVNIAHALNISERIIGLTMVAFGTSLPELVTCIVAAVKNRSDLVIGNIIGSNIFNILFVLGVTGLIKPIPFEYSFLADATWGIVATVFLWMFVFRDRKLTWGKGLIFLLLYAVYLVWLIK